MNNDKKNTMHEQLMSIIETWLKEPILNSDMLKYVKTTIENDELVIHASIKFWCPNNKVFQKIFIVEKRISLKAIAPERLKDELNELVNGINLSQLISFCN